MSLVNDMLNDLEARRGKEPARPLSLDWVSGQGSVAGRKSNQVTIIIVVAVVMIALVLGSWLYLQAKATSVVAAPVPKANQPSPIAAVESVEPATLKTIAWQQDGGLTVMKLALSDNKPYSISRDGHLLRLRFYDVKSQPGMPVVSPLAPVESVVMQAEGADLVAILSIKGDFSFSDRLSGADDNTVEVLLKSQQRREPAAVAKATAPASKQVASTAAAQSSPRNESTTVASRPAVSTTPKVAPKPVSLTLSQLDLRTEKQARDLLRKGESFQAQELLQQFVDANSGAIRSTRLLISLWMSQQRFEAANELLANALGQYPEDVDLRILRAQSLLAEQRVGDAVDWLMMQAPDMNTYPQYYELLALAARRDQQYQLSEQAYRGLVSTDPNRGDWLVGLGIALDAQARTTEARGVYQQALVSPRLSAALKQYAQQRLSAN